MEIGFASVFIKSYPAVWIEAWLWRKIESKVTTP